MSKFISGLHTALITPFNNDSEQSIDWKGLEKLIEFQIENNVDGILLLGTTAETPTLTEIEKKEILLRAIKQINKRVPVMVGIGSNDTKVAAANAKLAEELGADSLLLVSPYYNKPTQNGLFKHFEFVANSTSLPIIAYNIPGRCVVNINNSTMLKIAQLPNITGVKEASGDLSQMMDLILQSKTIAPNFIVTSGDDSLTLPLMSLGGKGVISVVSNLFPKEIKEMLELASIGNFDAARKVHYKLLDIFNVAFIETNPSPIKFLMSLRNLPSGGCRLPLVELEDSSKEILRKSFSNFN